MKVGFIVFQNIKIKTFGLILSILLIATLITSVISFFAIFGKIEDLSKNWEHYDKGPAEKSAYLSEIRGAIGYGGVSQNFRDYIIRGDEKYKELTQESIQKSRDYVSAYRKIGITDEEEISLDQILKSVSEFEKNLEWVTQAHEYEMDATTIDADIQMDDTPTLKALQTLDNIVIQARANSSAMVEASKTSVYTTATIGMVFIAILVLIPLLFFKWFDKNRVQEPMSNLMNLMQKMTQGDFTQRIEKKADDEIGMLTHMCCQFQQEISNLVKQIQSSAHTVSSSSTIIHEKSDSLNAIFDEQKDAINNIHLSMNESSQSIDNINEQAVQTSHVVGEVSEDMNNAIHGMHALVEKSKSINDVLNVIKGITEQTNLLALNAAIEAARAGEAGAGFAVVADEVRKLAQSTNESATDIENVITELQKLISDAQDKMEHVNESVEGINEKSKIVSDSTEAQANAFRTIASALDQFQNQMENSAQMVREGKNTSQNLNDNSKEMEKTVSFFKVQ